MSTEPKFGEWVDANVRQPAKPGHYLVTFGDRLGGTRYTAIGWWGSYQGVGVEQVSGWGNNRVIAWMPLPPPLPPPRLDPFEEWFSELTKNLPVAAPYCEMKAAWDAAIEYAQRSRE